MSDIFDSDDSVCVFALVHVTGILRLESRDIPKHPIMHKTALHNKNYAAQHASG